MQNKELVFLKAYEAYEENPNGDNEDDMVMSAVAVVADYPQLIGKVSYKELYKKLMKNRHVELCDTIRAANHAYYDMDAPTMSDRSYDELLHELRGWNGETFPNTTVLLHYAPIVYGIAGTKKQFKELKKLIVKSGLPKGVKVKRA